MMNTSQIGTQLNPRAASLKRLALALALVSGLSVSAQTLTTSTNFTIGAVVPDDDPSGLASAKIVSTPIVSIAGVRVNLKLSGTFNGDLYCFLSHGGSNTVLLNRVGRTANNSLGYSDSGINVTFDDLAPNGDIHNYRLALNGNNNIPISGALTNTWAPDGRASNPSAVLDTDPRTALLNSFAGLNPNGEWVLFVADMEAGDVYTLDNWGLEITGYTAPSIVAAPADVTAECSSGSALFTVNAAGSSPLSYQWRFNNVAIPGQTGTSLSLNNVTFANAGSYDVVVTNNYGSIISPAASLTIQDTTAPVADAASLPAVVAQCSANLPAAPTATDACEGQIIGTPDQSGPFSAGDYTITWTFTDSHHNSSVQTQAVHVHDTTPPVITLVGNSTVTVECHAGYADAGATASDNCDGNISGRIATVNPVDPNTPATYTVTYNVSDLAGNPAAQVTRTVIVQDTLAPVPDLASLADVTGQCSASVTAPTAHDACEGLVTATTTDPLTYTAQGDYTVHWTYADSHGNRATQTQAVHVHDTIAPTVTCPGDITVVTTNTGGVAVTFNPTATDNCGVQSVIAQPASGSNFPIGTNLVTVTATDVNGNSNQCSFHVVVVYNPPPVAGNITMGAVENHPRSLLTAKVIAHCSETDSDTITVVSVSANSTNGGTVTLGSTNIIYNPAPNFVGTDLFTYTVSDGRGGYATGSVIVTVTSENDPSFNRIGSITVTSSAVTVRFAGIPGDTYYLQRAATPTGPWSTITSFVVPDNGIATVVDSSPLENQGYYRTVSPNQ